MRFALLSLVDVKSTPFMSLLIYQTDEHGISHLIAEIAKPYVDFGELTSDLIAYDIDELQTDSTQFYRELVAKQIPVIYRKELTGTGDHIRQHEEMFIELYELNAHDEEEKQPLPRWRAFCITLLQKIITKIKGDYLYDN